MRIYTTCEGKVFHESEAHLACDERAEMRLVVCRPDRTYQHIVGFGGAFTEAGAYVFAQMPPYVQDRFIDLCFGGTATGAGPAQGGNAYSLCRTHAQSCDFALGSYAYVRPFDRALKTFSIERDRRLLLPFIQCGLAANPRLELAAAPWSPPAFMKTNRMMAGGGRLRRSCYDAWARLLVRYVAAYAEEGVRIGRLSVQNEPMARQTWDSCLYTPEEEAAFAVRHLRPALDEAGFVDVKLFAWDHNADRLLDRAEAVFAAADASAESAESARAVRRGEGAAFDGVAFHWYAGDHFEQVRAVADAFPDKELLFTEGCVEHSRADAPSTELRKAEQYGHALIGCLDAGAQGFVDWNLLLDERGGPNHVGNFCEAPLMYDREQQALTVHRSFYYLGHVSRFVRPGARRFLVSRFSGDIECVGFVNPDGTRVLVALNRTERDVPFRVAERPFAADVVSPAHSMSTMVWDAQEARPPDAV